MLQRVKVKKLKSEIEDLRNLIERLVGDDCSISDGVGDIQCYFCNCYLNLSENHELDCPYIEAKNLLGE